MVLLGSTSLPIGKFKAPEFDLPATDGKYYSLADFSNSKGLVVVFSCNHCPYARAAWPLLIELASEYQPKEIGFVAINPNDEVSYPEDSFAIMKKRFLEWGINFPYLRDKSQEVASNYQAQCTPDVYIFDEKRFLYYHGRINDNWQDPANVKRHDLKNAIDDLLAGKASPKEQYPSLGCSIKWFT